MKPILIYFYKVRYDSLTEAVRLLGCFENTLDIETDDEEVAQAEGQEVFEEFFHHNKEHSRYKTHPFYLFSSLFTPFFSQSMSSCIGMIVHYTMSFHLPDA